MIKNMDKGLTVPKWVLIVFFPLVPALKMEQAYDPGELCKYNHDCQEKKFTVEKDRNGKRARGKSSQYI